MIHDPIKIVKGGFSYYDIFFKSKEEIYFLWYLTDLKDAGYIEDIVVQPSMEVLPERKVMIKVKDKIKQKHLFQDLTYTADFLVKWDPKAKDILFDGFNPQCTEPFNKLPFIANAIILSDFKTNWFSYIDVKGNFGGQHNNSAVTFPIIQKLVWFMKGLYVNKIIPDKLFEHTFTPVRYHFTDGGISQRKRNWVYHFLPDLYAH